MAKLAKDKNRDKKSLAELGDPRIKILNEMKMDSKASLYSPKNSSGGYGSNKSTKHTKTINGNSIQGILSTNFSEKEKDPITRIRTTEEDDNEYNNDIVDSINIIGNILKTKNKKIEDNDEKMKELNILINNYTHNDSSKLLLENNTIKRDTFIDNNFNKKLRSSEIESNLIEDVYNNSDMRMKKYGILFNFINNNIKEITDLVQIPNKIIEESIDCTNKNISEFASINDDFYKYNDLTINLTNFQLNDMTQLISKTHISMFDKSEKTECEFNALESSRNNSSVDAETSNKIEM